jgi:hypothetical protein
VHSNVDAYGGPPAHPDASHSDAPTEDGSVRPDVFMGGALYGGSPVGEDAHRREEDTGVTADAFMGGALYGGSPIEEDSGVPMGGAAYGGTPDFDAGDK